MANNEGIAGAILQALDIGLIYYDAEDRLAGFNAVAARIYNDFFGIALHEGLIGRHINDCHPTQESREKLLDRLRSLQTQEMDADTPKVFLHKGIYWIEQHRGLFDTQGNYLGLVITLLPGGLMKHEEAEQGVEMHG